jgi:cytochrome d ubiquinol oxidase subunit I
MEAHYHTQAAAPLSIGGIPDDEQRRLIGAIEIPYMLSVLAHGDPQAVVIGLDRIPRDAWPPTLVCHLAFQTMVATGSLLALLGLSFLVFRRLRPHWIEHPRYLRCIAFAAPLGFLAVEAGWTVTEVGRQPWIIYGVMRTRDAVSPMPGLIWPLTSIVIVYAILSVVTWFVTVRLIRAFERGLAASPRPAAGPFVPEPAAHG